MTSEWCEPRIAAVTPGASAGVSGDLVSMLDALAQTIVEALGFGVAAFNIVCPDGSLQVVSVAGHEDAREVLLGHVDTAETWDRVLSWSEPWGRLRFADHRNEAADATTLSWVPEVEAVEGEDAWHPEDALFAPLVSESGDMLGILSVDLPPGGRRPDQASRRSLEAFAMAAALAIEHSTLRARAEASERIAQELAAQDRLTGVGNRSLMMQRLAHIASARPEQREPLAVVFIDLDGFKAVNDVHTHAGGDHVLQQVAGRITAVVRPHDTVARWGGDEFLVLLEQLDDEVAAQRIAERLTSAIAEPIPYRGSELRLTASVGVAYVVAGAELDVEALVLRADTAMYSVKDSGGNGYAA